MPSASPVCESSGILPWWRSRFRIRYQEVKGMVPVAFYAVVLRKESLDALAEEQRRDLLERLPTFEEDESLISWSLMGTQDVDAVEAGLLSAGMNCDDYAVADVSGPMLLTGPNQPVAFSTPSWLTVTTINGRAFAQRA